MPKNKLKHFAENVTFPNFLQPEIDDVINDFYLKGKWNSNFFKNNNPIVLELGCGKGEYTVSLARKHPNKNFIGIDRKGARMWRGAKTTVDEDLRNIAFLRTQIELTGKCFGKNEVNEIWLTFPDPQPKKKKASKRLTSPPFLEIYHQFLIPGSIIHLKTDNAGLFIYTLKIIEEYKHELIFQTKDLYNSGYEGDVMEVQTYYEKKFLEEGQKINYLQFRLNDIIHEA
ncbi:MAG: tRNA (guanosine(46)-N7)-methyltransferase TrmB [Bacteroidales bacterium]|nr:tRNA (guanosine(46)-N7)-methyltransferase TrmB [Bacteroidales bacterium]